MPTCLFIDRRILIRGKTQMSAWLLFAFAASSTICLAQTGATPQPAADEPMLQRLEGTDVGSGIHYVRFMLRLRGTGETNQKTQPRFTVECQDEAGKRDMLWFVSFGGVEDPGFVPPFRPTKALPHPPHLPAENLKMTFEGYIKPKPFIRSWTLLPSGELRYRNGGLHSPNMESAQWFLRFLNSLPGLRIGYAKTSPGDPGEVFFPTRSLLDEVNKTAICSP